mgnify:CR=1 FL=1|jgi:hypothetical protein
MLKLRDYIEIARLAQELVEEQGLSYKTAIEKAKEKLLSDRVGAHKSENSISKEFNDSITEN